MTGSQDELWPSVFPDLTTETWLELEQCLSGIYGVDAESTFSLFHSLILHSSRLIETFQDCRSARQPVVIWVSNSTAQPSSAVLHLNHLVWHPIHSPEPSALCFLMKIMMVVVNPSTYIEYKYKHLSYTLHGFHSAPARPNEHHFVLICSGKNLIHSPRVCHSRH